MGTREIARLVGEMRRSRKAESRGWERAVQMKTQGLKPTGDFSNTLTNLLPTVCGGRLL